jgi:hypothetical protein
MFNHQARGIKVGACQIGMPPPNPQEWPKYAADKLTAGPKDGRKSSRRRRLTPQSRQKYKKLKERSEKAAEGFRRAVKKSKQGSTWSDSKLTSSPSFTTNPKWKTSSMAWLVENCHKPHLSYDDVRRCKYNPARAWIEAYHQSKEFREAKKEAQRNIFARQKIAVAGIILECYEGYKSYQRNVMTHQRCVSSISDKTWLKRTLAECPKGLNPLGCLVRTVILYKKTLLQLPQQSIDLLMSNPHFQRNHNALHRGESNIRKGLPSQLVVPCQRDPWKNDNVVTGMF